MAWLGITVKAMPVYSAASGQTAQSGPQPAEAFAGALIVLEAKHGIPEASRSLAG
jgi:hypothetical protein